MKNKISIAIVLMLLMVSVASAKTTIVYEKEQGTGKEAAIVVKDSLDEWLDELEKFECDGCGPRYSRLDSNDRYSYGCLQFQEATFLEKEHRYIPEGYIDTDEYKYPDRIYNCKFQKSIARRMFESEGARAASHWSTSIYNRGLGLPPGY